jgi:hypothetical protein
MEFLKGFWTWVVGLSLTWWQNLIFLVVIGVIFVIFNFTKTKEFWNYMFKKRTKLSCEDCLRIVENKKQTMKIKIEKIENGILKSQMNFAEQKMLELLFLFINNFSKTFKNSIDKDEVYVFLKYLQEKYKDDENMSWRIKEVIEEFNSNKEIIQNKLFWSVIFEGLEKSIKNEIRRSFKENGFHELNEDGFKIYLQNRFKILTSTINQQIINSYPKNVGMVVSQEEILNQIPLLQNEINNIIADIYTEAKKIKLNSDKEIKEIETHFFQEMKEFEEELKRG